MHSQLKLSSSHQWVPALPFGNDSAEVETSTKSIYESVGTALAGGFDIFPITEDRSLFQRSTAITIGEIKLAANAGTPMCLRRKEVPYKVFKMPIFGIALHTIKNNPHRLVEQAGKHAIFHSGEEREFISTPGYGVVTTSINELRLITTMNTMLGRSSPSYTSTLNLNQDREVPLQVGGNSFDQLFTQHFASIKAFEKRPDMLARLGLEDSFYRCFVMLLSPELFFGEEAISRKRVLRSRNQLDVACDYIQANLDGVLTLSDIESISGMSARNLQYAFAKRFGCTPMQWVREQRLNLAHYRLIHAEIGDTVTYVATSCGFTKLGEFAQHYCKRFHELPSETLKKSLK